MRVLPAYAVFVRIILKESRNSVSDQSCMRFVYLSDKFFFLPGWFQGIQQGISVHTHTMLAVGVAVNNVDEHEINI